MLSSSVVVRRQEPAGSIRGVVTDKDFGTPIAGAQVVAVEAGLTVSTTEQGQYVFQQVPPGKYTLVFSREGYARQVKADVVVSAGRLTDVDVSLLGEFTEMEEFLVQDVLQFGAGTEAAMLKLRFDSPALMDSISSDLMSRAGASDAASALRLVPGASVQGGKFAVIRGLPDRYVNGQMNGVRLPTADENKRAVELDQFPASVIESVRVTKTFTPDQQGDASGGAVDVRLKGIPDESILQLKGQLIYNTQVTGRSDFLTYDGGGLDFWGSDDGSRDIQDENIGNNWDGALGTSRGYAPLDSKWSFTAGDKHQFDNGVKIGGLTSLFYERRHSFYDNGREDSLWVTHPGDPMTPHTSQGTPEDGTFKTSLFDVTQGKESVKWGGLAAFGLETEKHSLNLVGLYTQSIDDTATLATDTRGKAYYFPGYNPDDPNGTGHEPGNRFAAPYLRLETLEYTQRTTGTLQLNGKHELSTGEFTIGDAFKCKDPELDWTVAFSSAGLNQPDKRQFGAIWVPGSFYPGPTPYVSPPMWYPFKPLEFFTIGNLQRIWKQIDEESQEYALNVKLPFEQWSGEEGSLKAGFFADRLKRRFDQETFSNFGDSGAGWEGGWNDPWSAEFPFDNHPVFASTADVDYDGKQDLTAGYLMCDMPLSASWTAIGGARVETMKLGIVNSPEPDAKWFPPGAIGPVDLHAGDADVSFEQTDVMPSLGLVYAPSKQWTFRSAYSQTVARQTFKELTPIVQQEYLGGPVFIGNPDLKLSSVDNYDLRVDYTPSEGRLVSASWFKKDIRDPIEYVQRLASFTFTTPVNYPKGELTGYELEVRQALGPYWHSLDGLSLGANATFIDSEVTLPAEEAAGFSLPNIAAPMSSRDMTDAPDHLYNFFATYDVPDSGTQFAVFYTIQGDTLVEGAGQSLGQYFIPNVYAKEYDSLNVSVSQKFGKYFALMLQAKNLTNTRIEEVYRSPYIGDDVTKSSYTKGIEYSLGLSVTMSF